MRRNVPLVASVVSILVLSPFVIVYGLEDGWTTYEDEYYVISIPDSFVVKEKGISKFDKNENKKLEAVDKTDTKTYLSITPESLPTTTVYVNNHDGSAFVPLPPLSKDWNNVSDSLIKTLWERHYKQEMNAFSGGVYSGITTKNKEFIEDYKMSDGFTINNSPSLGALFKVTSTNTPMGMFVGLVITGQTQYHLITITSPTENYEENESIYHKILNSLIIKK